MSDGDNVGLYRMAPRPQLAIAASESTILAQLSQSVTSRYYRRALHCQPVCSRKHRLSTVHRRSTYI